MFLLYSKMKREMKNFLLKWKKPLLWLTGFVLLVLCWQVWDGLFDAGLALAAIGYVGRKNRIQRTVDDRYCS